MSGFHLRFSAFAAIAIASLALGATFAAAGGASPRQLGKFGNWEAFVQDSGGVKLCYAASLPVRSKNAPAARGHAYAMISDRPADKSFGVVGLAAGFALKKDSPATLEVNGARFDLYVAGDTAWTRDDKSVVAALEKGKQATFVALPAKGEPVADLYDLAGFSDARGSIDKECRAK